MPKYKQADFLLKLEQEVKIQSKLETTHLLPTQLGGLGRLIAAYPWQFFLISSLLSAGMAVWFGV